MSRHDFKWLWCLSVIALVLNIVFIVSPVLARTYDFLPPEGKTFLFIGQDKQAIDDYVAATRVVPAGVMLYTSIQDISGLNQPFDNGAGVHHGSYLMKKYSDSSLQIGLYMVNALGGVIDGSYDRNIDKLAHWIEDQNRPVYLRIGYEFDSPGNGYDPRQYILAYQKIVDRFRELRVDNVVFVWHSGAFLAQGPDPINWFPGIDYVDWVAVSLFAPAQFEQIKKIAALAHLWNKPLMIAESSPMGSYSLKAKMDWFNKYFRIIEAINPQVVCYINSNWDVLPMWAKEKFGDARIEQNAELKDMWLEEIDKVRFVHGR